MHVWCGIMRHKVKICLRKSELGNSQERLTVYGHFFV